MDQYRLYVRANTTFDRRIQQADLDDLPLLLPPLEEQRRIADFLDDQTTRIDHAIQLRQQQTRLLGMRALSPLLAVIDHDDDAVAAPIPWFPLWKPHWTLQRLSWVVTCHDGIRVPLSGEERSFCPGDYPYYGASTIVDYIDDFLFDGDFVLIGEDGASLENAAFDVVQEPHGKFWVNNHAHVLEGRGVENSYLAEYLRCVDRSTLVSGATRPKITQEDLLALPTPVPPLEEQADLARRCKAMRAESTVARKTVQGSAELLLERKRSLVMAAVTGAFDVSSASPRGANAVVSG